MLREGAEKMRWNKFLGIILITTALVFVGSYLLLFVASAGLSLATESKYTDVPVGLLYILDPILAIFLLNSLTVVAIIATLHIRMLHASNAEQMQAELLPKKGKNAAFASGALFFLLLFLVFPEHLAFAWLRNAVFANVSCPKFFQRIAFGILYALFFYASLFFGYKRELRFSKYKFDKTKKKQTIYQIVAFSILKTVGLAVLYYAFGILLPMAVMLVAGMAYTLLKMYHIALIVILLLVVLYLRKFFKTYFARKKFYSKLEQCCAEKGYHLSKPKHLLSSLFVRKTEVLFEVEAKQKKYSCVIVSSLRKRNNIFLGKREMTLVREWGLFGRTLFRTFSNTKLPSVEGTLVLVTIPDQNKVYIHDAEGMRSVYLGEKVFDYFVYNENMFLGNLERDTIK